MQAPEPRTAGIGWDLGQEEAAGSLVPEHELRLALAQDVAQNLVVMLGGARRLDLVPPPGGPGIESGIRVLPPPELLPLIVGPEDKVEVAIPIEVVHRPASLDGQVIGLDHEPIPPRFRPPVPDQGWGLLTKREDEIVHAVPVEVGDHGAGLLGRGTRYGQIALLAAELPPADLGGGVPPRAGLAGVRRIAPSRKREQSRHQDRGQHGDLLAIEFLSGRVAAVHGKDRTRDKAGLVRGQEEDRRGDLLGAADPAHRVAVLEHLEKSLGIGVLSIARRSIGVSTVPGQMQLTRMPRAAYSTASWRESWSAAPLLGA